MASYWINHKFVLRDAYGHEATVGIRNYGADTITLAAAKTSNDALNTALAAVTNAKVVNRSVSVHLDSAHGRPAASTTAGDYNLAQDKTTMQFANAEGSRMVLSIPAPLASDFLSTTPDIVDTTDTNVAALATAIAAQCHDEAGNALNLAEGGSRRSGSRPQRPTRG